MRNFDPTQQFEAIKKSATDAVKEIFPVEGKLRTIRLTGVEVDDSIGGTDYKSQIAAKAKEGTWGSPIYANLELVDKATNKVIDKSKVKLFTLPKLTDRFSYIVSGNEYQVHNQLRLKPGVYTLRKQNGELKTQVNLSKGKNFDLAFNERSGLFTIQKVGGGQANIPLYPVLTHLGISPSAVASAWGAQLQQANHDTDPKSVARAETAFGIKPGQLKEYFAGTSISPDTTKAVLGQSFDKVDGPLLLAAAKDLLQVHLGKKEPTDRDSLAFKELHSVEDFIHERIQKNKQPLAFKLRRNIDNLKRTRLAQIVNPGAFQGTVESFFTQDDKSATPEQTNPLEMLSGQYMTTIMGSGGIGSDHAVTPAMREIHPSHYGFLDPVHTPESSRVGVNLHLPMGIHKEGKELRMTVIKADRTPLTLTPTEAFDKRLAFPGQLDSKSPTVKVQYQGKVMDVPRAQVDYYTPTPSSLFSWSTNLIPFLPSNQGNRAMMASKMLEQAIALKHREAPLVQVEATPNMSFEQAVGAGVARMAPADGVVKKITPDSIVLQTSEGSKTIDLYNNFTLNRKSFMNHEPVVKVGDKVKKGQLLADSNFTKGGTLALGTNMRVAYLPYKGLNFEDGIVITESAADKLTSEHIHKKSMDLGENHVLGLSAFRSFYPNAISAQNMAKFDETGVIKKGQTIRQGEALAAVLQRRAPSATISVVNKALAERPKDASLYWTLEDDGRVLDVQRTPTGITVLVKTEERAKIGDKLSGRMGNKGIITKIIRDHEAPHSADGKPVDVLLNPHGVISRINVGQLYESAVGKAALRTGKPFRIGNFTGENYLDTTKGIIDKAGAPDKEELFDPTTGKSLGKVHVGNPYILKLFKQGTVNYSVRQGGPGTPYDANLQPLKAGGEEGAKAMDVLTTYAMLAHGARANLREMGTVKSNQNDEFWKALKSGQALPPPKSPFVYDKFMNYLRAAGIDVKKDGSKLTLAPLTDKQVLKQSSGEIKAIQFYRGKGEREPMKGGFFDPSLTGGYKGEKWNHIELTEPVVNPVFENAVSKLTGLGNKYEEVVHGRMHLDPKTGTFNTEGKGLTGGRAVEHLLKQIDVEGELRSLSRKAPKATGAALDDINKRMRYLTALKAHGLSPAEAYIRKSVPILPPVYRPVYPLPDGSMGSSDVNVLYQHAGVLNTMAKLPVMDLLAEEEKAPLRKDLHESVKAISGLTDLNIKGRTREGFISEIKGGTGGQPKEGFFIGKMISKKQDFVGRGTIIPEPDLGVDQMAMPEEMAWKLFEPFVVRELKNHGKSPLQAKDEIKAKSALAKRALDIVMSQRHVLLNRAPSLHKFSIMAFKPQITAGRALKIPPLVVKGFNADFNGDSCNINTICHTRVWTDEGRWEYLSLCAGELFPLLVNKSVEEMVADAKGYTAIYELAPGRLQTVSLINNAPTWVDVRRLTVHTSHGPCYQIETHTGTRVVATEHHNFSYIDENFDFQCIKTEVMPSNVLIPKARPRLNQEFQKIQIGEKSHILDEDFAWMLGHYAGDGCSTDGTVSICDTEAALLDRVCRTIKALFNYETKRQSTAKHAGCITRVYNKTIAAWFANECGARCGDKRIPSCVMSSPDSVRLAYVQGLFQAEGNISKDAFGNWLARIEMKNRPFLEALRFIMASVGIGSYIHDSRHKDRTGFAVVRLVKDDMHKLALQEGRKAELLKVACEVKDSRLRKNCYDIVPFSSALLGEIRSIGLKMRGLSKEDKRRLSAWQEAFPGRRVNINDHFKTKCHFISRHIARDIIHTYGAFATGLFEKWAQLVLNEDLLWEEITSIAEVPREEVMFDFTVPDGEIFCIQNGLLTHNTMTVHVPISEEANREAARLLPSRNLFQPGTGRLMVAPSQEAQVGLYYLSRTEAGQKALAQIIGPKFKVPEVFNKKSTGALLQQMAKEMTAPEFATAVAKLKTAGEAHAFNTGFTLGIDDLVGVRADRDKIVAHATAEAAKAKTEAGIAAVNKEATALMDRAIDAKLKGKDNPLYDMVESGARGDRSQLRSIIATPLFMTDAKGRTVPTPIKRSYSEGLSVGDYWTSMYGARTGAMMRSIQTSLPGAFNKDVMATTIDNVVTAKDCGTKDGVALPITDTADVMDRYTAGDQGGVPHNTLVDQRVLTTLRTHGIKIIKVRSPLTCRLPKGVCAHCHGLDEHSHLPELGDNVGAKAGQTISEPLIQIVMNARHTGGVAGARGSSQGGYQRIDQLLKLPKIVVGAAALAPKAGKITKVEKGLAGGWNVTVGDTVTHVDAGLELKAKMGDHVEAGDTLSSGVLKPQDLVRYKGMQSAQQYIVDELHKAYHEEGVPIQRRIFETVVRSLGNTTQVLNHPKEGGFLPGDVAPYTVVQDWNRNLETSLPVEEAAEHKLAEAAGGLRVGHVLTSDDVKALKARGVAQVRISRDPIVHAPFLKGITTLPLLKRDWMAALGYRYLAKSLTEGASQGWKTDVAGEHPIPALAHAATFGQGKAGKY